MITPAADSGTGNTGDAGAPDVATIAPALEASATAPDTGASVIDAGGLDTSAPVGVSEAEAPEASAEASADNDGPSEAACVVMPVQSDPIMGRSYLVALTCGTSVCVPFNCGDPTMPAGEPGDMPDAGAIAACVATGIGYATGLPTCEAMGESPVGNPMPFRCSDSVAPIAFGCVPYPAGVSKGAYCCRNDGMTITATDGGVLDQ